MKYDKTLPCCPICGSTAFISHDIVDGFGFGWSVGCPRACIADGIHGADDEESFQKLKLVFLGLNSKQQAINVWEDRCKGERKDD